MKNKVPMALLHQKVYGTARRLDKLTIIEFPKKEEKKTAIVSIDRGRVISPGVKISDNVFGQEGWLRRFFFMLEPPDRLQCRSCGDQVVGSAARSGHTACYLPTSQALREIMKDELCVVCEENLKGFGSEFMGLPICSEACFSIWEHHNPEAFEWALSRVKANPTPWQAGVYGGVK